MNRWFEFVLLGIGRYLYGRERGSSRSVGLLRRVKGLKPGNRQDVDGASNSFVGGC